MSLFQREFGSDTGARQRRLTRLGRGLLARARGRARRVGDAQGRGRHRGVLGRDGGREVRPREMNSLDKIGNK